MDNQYCNNYVDSDKVKSSQEAFSSRNLAGRPSGITNIKKRIYKERVRDAKYSIICRYVYEIGIERNRSRSKKNIFSDIVAEEIIKLGLHANFQFPFRTALSRIRRLSFHGEGGYCPLVKIEQKIIDLLLCMSKIKRSLTVSESLKLINELIDGTKMQQCLIDWKIKHKIYYKSIDDLGRVGHAWWRKFLLRNNHLLRSKSGKKYAFDRSNFSTYLNFSDMYEHIEDILVYDSKVAIKFDKPVWMDNDGNIVVNEDDSYGCKVSIDIIRPDMCVVLDEVGCNLSQEKDSSKGGQMFVCGVKEQPYQSIATKANHFTCLGLTLLNGEALLCVVIIQGKRRDILAEAGINCDAIKDMNNLDTCSDDDDLNFFWKTMDQVNYFQVALCVAIKVLKYQR